MPHRLLPLASLLFILAFSPAFGQTPVVEGGPSDLPSPQPTVSPSKVESMPGLSKAIVLHKPMPPASWGRLVQYHKEQIFALSEKNRETLYEFVFQNEAGVIHTAVYHENASGNGYWEVLAWDQP
jgi:hypothetical protein